MIYPLTSLRVNPPYTAGRQATPQLGGEKEGFEYKIINILVAQLIYSLYI
jgi:hypothetical protein